MVWEGFADEEGFADISDCFNSCDFGELSLVCFDPFFEKVRLFSFLVRLTWGRISEDGFRAIYEDPHSVFSVLQTSSSCFFWRATAA